MATSLDLSDTGWTRALNAALGISTPGALTTYIALLTSAPSETAIGTEFNAASYVRQAPTWTAPAGSPRSISNSNVLTFGPVGAITGSKTIGWLALMDAVSGGSLANMIAYGTLLTPKTPSSSDAVSFAIGAIVLAGS